jgi:isoleucyl-tRNA synthetase
LNTLISEVESNYEDYEPTKLARLIQDFVINKLSNWYIRLSRRRFWKGEYNVDKISAYQTLYECLEKIAIISAPIAPFFMEQLYTDLHTTSDSSTKISVHLSQFPKSDKSKIDTDLEEKMDFVQKITTMVLSLRKKERVRVRQPLQKIMIPIDSDKMKEQILSVEDILLSELNIKEIEFISSDSNIPTLSFVLRERTIVVIFCTKSIFSSKSVSILLLSDFGNCDKWTEIFVLESDVVCKSVYSCSIKNGAIGAEIIAIFSKHS